MSIPASMHITKNKLLHDETFIALLDVTFPGETSPLYFACNNEAIDWNGHTWAASAIGIDQIDQSASGELPSFNLYIENVSRSLAPYLDGHSGGQGTEINLYVVDTANLAENTPYFSVSGYVVGCEEMVDLVTFKIGRQNPMLKNFPRERIMKLYCRYPIFKGPRCEYAGSETSCDRRFTTCRYTMHNAERSGAFPSIGKGGIYA